VWHRLAREKAGFSGHFNRRRSPEKVRKSPEMPVNARLAPREAERRRALLAALDLLGFAEQ
jgi:hypothetical protein